MTSTEQAIIDAALRVLQRRAASLRDRAAGLVSTIDDKDGHKVPVIDPQARVMLNTAVLFDLCAADIVSQTCSHPVETAETSP